MGLWCQNRPKCGMNRNRIACKFVQIDSDHDFKFCNPIQNYDQIQKVRCNVVSFEWACDCGSDSTSLAVWIGLEIVGRKRCLPWLLPVGFLLELPGDTNCFQCVLVLFLFGKNIHKMETVWSSRTGTTILIIAIATVCTVRWTLGFIWNFSGVIYIWLALQIHV